MTEPRGCLARHGHEPCDCVPNPAPYLWCVQCRTVTEHRFVSATAFAYDCDECGERRRYGCA